MDKKQTKHLQKQSKDQDMKPSHSILYTRKQELEMELHLETVELDKEGFL